LEPNRLADAICVPPILLAGFRPRSSDGPASRGFETPSVPVGSRRTTDGAYDRAQKPV
jgi:hypothetical protein